MADRSADWYLQAKRDLDVLIIISESDKRFIDRAEEFRGYFDGLGIETDLFVCTEDEVQNTPLAEKALSNSALQFSRNADEH